MRVSSWCTIFLKIKQHIGISKSTNSGNGNSGLQQLHPLTSSLSRIIKQVAYCASKSWLNSQQNMFSKLNKWDFAGWYTCNLQWQDKIKNGIINYLPMRSIPSCQVVLEVNFLWIIWTENSSQFMKSKRLITLFSQPSFIHTVKESADQIDWFLHEMSCDSKQIYKSLKDNKFKLETNRIYLLQVTGNNSGVMFCSSNITDVYHIWILWQQDYLLLIIALCNTWKRFEKSLCLGMMVTRFPRKDYASYADDVLERFCYYW